MYDKDLLNDEYFEWMYNLVCNERYYKKNLSYRKLLNLLHNIQFTYTFELDSNRAKGGEGFRYKFGYERGYPYSVIKDNIDIHPCSVLEMMVALASNIEEQIMDDPTYGDRTGQWFWGMVVSLGLGHMSDTRFDQRYAEIVIDKFLNREYEPDGKGGLFTLQNPAQDLRNVDIWIQAMWYLNEFLEE